MIIKKYNNTSKYMLNKNINIKILFGLNILIINYIWFIILMYSYLDQTMIIIK